jgi:hypothetical protein
VGRPPFVSPIGSAGRVQRRMPMKSGLTWRARRPAQRSIYRPRSNSAGEAPDASAPPGRRWPSSPFRPSACASGGIRRVGAGFRLNSACWGATMQM